MHKINTPRNIILCYFSAFITKYMYKSLKTIYINEINSHYYAAASEYNDFYVNFSILRLHNSGTKHRTASVTFICCYHVTRLFRRQISVHT